MFSIMHQTLGNNELYAHTLCQDNFQNGMHKIHTIGRFDNGTLVRINVNTSRIFTGEKIYLKQGSNITNKQSIQIKVCQHQ